MSDKRVMTPELRKRLAGLLPFAEGSTATFYPPAMQVEGMLSPWFRVKPYSKAGLQKYRAAAARVRAGDKDADLTACIIELWTDRDGLDSWGDVPDSEGDDFPYNAENVAKLANLEDLVYTVNNEILEYTVGVVKKEEKQGLDSSPPPA